MFAVPTITTASSNDVYFAWLAYTPLPSIATPLRACQRTRSLLQMSVTPAAARRSWSSSTVSSLLPP
jgi:hypothetical protein